MEEQRKCPRLCDLYAELERAGNTEITKPYALFGGVIYMLTTKGEPLIVVPDSMIFTVMEMCHSSPGAGHPGYDRMYEKLKERYTFPKMYSLVAEY